MKKKTCKCRNIWYKDRRLESSMSLEETEPWPGAETPSLPGNLFLILLFQFIVEFPIGGGRSSQENIKNRMRALQACPIIHQDHSGSSTSAPYFCNGPVSLGSSNAQKFIHISPQSCSKVSLLLPQLSSSNVHHPINLLHLQAAFQWSVYKDTQIPENIQGTPFLPVY